MNKISNKRGLFLLLFLILIQLTIYFWSNVIDARKDKRVFYRMHIVRFFELPAQNYLQPLSSNESLAKLKAVPTTLQWLSDINYYSEDEPLVSNRMSLLKKKYSKIKNRKDFESFRDDYVKSTDRLRLSNNNNTFYNIVISYQ